MSEQYFLQKCIVSVEDAKGSCTNMSNLDVEQPIKQEYELIVKDITKHLGFLNSRLKYLKEN